jgi:hypothetical protein
MFARRTVKAGAALVVAAAAIAGGPAIADNLGMGASSTPANLSASWEADKTRSAAQSADSHADVLEREKARKAAERKRAAAKAARSAVRGGTPTQNYKLGMQMCANAGFSSSQCTDLGKLWQKESGWNHKAQNRSSGAYGIPQALPGSKMGTVASDWRTNPATQIKWGLSYIKSRYGNPSNAWAHSVRVGWY